MSSGDFETVLYDDETWLNPVELATDLPMEDVVENSVCYVQSENTIYQFISGVWVIKAVAGGGGPAS